MAVITIDSSVPNPLLEVRMATIIVAEDGDRPTHIGLFEMDTEQGIIPLVVNRKAAAALMHELTDFLMADEEPRVVAAND